MSEQDFAQALEIYRTKYVEYRTTGRSEHKIAYENAETWIRNYLESVSTQIQSGKTFVDTFLQNYSTANPDMETLRSRFQQIRKEGPATQDEYIRLNRINENSLPPPDSTSYYIKAGVLAALIGAVFVVTTL